MAAPAHELVGLAAARLRTYAPLTDLIGEGRVFLKPGEVNSPPYVVMGEADVRRADGTELRSSTVGLVIHAFAETPNALQDVRAIAFLIGEALHGYPLALPSNALVTLDHRGDRVFYDRDNITGHAVIELRAVIETP